MNYYNEFDPKAAAWIQQLIDDKQIPYGYVDSRSILEVQPSDLSGFTQCHFFAGVGGWSLALHLAGWPTDRPVWTASLPCQPFSTAGKQLGTDDERHLSPTFLELVRQCRPPSLFGEQVASKLARTDWLPGIRLELEALGYSFGAADLCAPCAGEVGEGRIVRGDQESWERVIIGHPHIRQRLYWVADSTSFRREQRRTTPPTEIQRECSLGSRQHTRPKQVGVLPGRPQGLCGDGSHSGRRLGDTGSTADGLAQPRNIGAGSIVGETSGCGGGTVDAGAASLRQAHGKTGASGADPRSSGCDDGLADSSSGRREVALQPARDSGQESSFREAVRSGMHGTSDFTLLPCRDGKTRRTESGIFPLVNGIPRGVVPSGDPSDPSYANATAEARAVRLKGYGNAIVPPLAAMFIKTYMEVADV